MSFVVSVVGRKGGIGKTTTAMSLAAVTAEATRVLVVDTDPQRSASWWAKQAGPRLPFDVAVDTDPRSLRRLRDREHDVVIVDTQGSTAGRGVLQAVLEASDVALLPTQPAALTLVPTLELVAETVGPWEGEYRVLLGIVDPRSHADLDEARDLLRRHGVPFMQATVRRYRAHERAPLEGLVITQYAVKDRYSLRAVDDFRKVALELYRSGPRQLLPAIQAALDAGGVPAGAGQLF